MGCPNCGGTGIDKGVKCICQEDLFEDSFSGMMLIAKIIDICTNNLEQFVIKKDSGELRTTYGFRVSEAGEKKLTECIKEVMK